MKNKEWRGYNKATLNKNSEISQYLIERSKEDFGERIFAFTNFVCGCSEGLAIFQSGTGKVLAHIPTYSLEQEDLLDLDIEDIYLKIIKRGM